MGRGEGHFSILLGFWRNTQKIENKFICSSIAVKAVLKMLCLLMVYLFIE